MDAARMLYADAEPEDPAKGLAIRIYDHPVRNEKKSLDAGYPVYDDVPHVDVRIIGDNTFRRFAPISEEEKRQYHRHWKAFLENRKSEGIVGQVLEEWPPLSRGMVETYKHFGIRTVEQLASLTDANLPNIPQGRIYRDKAKSWIESAKAAAPLGKMEAEIRAMRDEMAAMKRERDEAMKALDKATAPPKR